MKKIVCIFFEFLLPEQKNRNFVCIRFSLNSQECREGFGHWDYVIKFCVLWRTAGPLQIHLLAKSSYIFGRVVFKCRPVHLDYILP